MWVPRFELRSSLICSKLSYLLSHPLSPSFFHHCLTRTAALRQADQAIQRALPGLSGHLLRSTLSRSLCHFTNNSVNLCSSQNSSFLHLQAYKLALCLPIVPASTSGYQPLSSYTISRVESKAKLFLTHILSPSFYFQDFTSCPSPSMLPAWPSLLSQRHTDALKEFPPSKKTPCSLLQPPSYYSPLAVSLLMTS